jgi:hypothetical protein
MISGVPEHFAKYLPIVVRYNQRFQSLWTASLDK